MGSGLLKRGWHEGGHEIMERLLSEAVLCGRRVRGLGDRLGVGCLYDTQLFIENYAMVWMVTRVVWLCWAHMFPRTLRC